MTISEHARTAISEIRRVAAPVIALLAPHRCGVCGSEGELICIACRTELGLAGDDRVAVGAAPVGCDAAAWIGPYEGGLGEIVRTMKYHGVPALAEPLGLGLRGAIRTLQHEIGDEVTLVSIPTDPARLRDRGFDHAALIAAAASRACSLALVPLLERTRAVPALHALGRSERRRTLDRVFAVRAGVTVPPRAILVDDIWTSGATFEAAAAALRAAGCATIGVAAVAREALAADA